MQASAAEASGSRAGRLIIATVVAVLFVGASSWWTADHVQSELTRRSQAALASAGIDATVRYEGLDAVLSGPVKDAAQAADAIGIVAQVPGTRHVTLRLAQPAGDLPGAGAASPWPGTGAGDVATPSGRASSAASPATGATPASAIRLPHGGIHFANGDAALSPQDHDYLDRVAAVLLENPRVRLLVKGHSDDVGPDELNWALSRLRAQAVVGYLRTRHVPIDRLRIQAYAATSPVAANDTPEGRAANRRVELVIQEV